MCNVSLINYGAKCVVVRRRTIDDKKTLAVLLEISSYGTVHNEKVILFLPPFSLRDDFSFTQCRLK